MAAIVLTKSSVSIALAVGVAAVALIVGIPIFLRMPPWCDFTLYDVSARTVLAGGVHYRDVFDTNLPGFVWCLVAIRGLFGNSLEIVRAIDLAIVAGITLILGRYVRAIASGPALAWFVAAVALFYPFTTEFSHCQRDVWMTLPIVAAVALRARRLENYSRGAFREGVLWGVAIWFKPHVLIVAVAVWFSTRRGRRDFMRNLAGGALVGLFGVALLVATGTWKPFIEVFTKWNTSYYRQVWSETPNVLVRFFLMFSLWSLLHLAAIPLAIRAIHRWRRGRGSLRLGLLCVCYLAMLFQACLLQRNFDYIHIPEMLLAFAILAATVPRLLTTAVLTILLGSLLAINIGPNDHWLLRMWADHHRKAYVNRLHRWPDCFRDLNRNDYLERQHALGIEREYFSSVNPVEIGEVADYLRSQGVREGEVIAWHDTPHAVYLDLGHRPPFRFMHITTTLISEDNFWRMTRELRKKLPGAKFVVTDMLHPMRSAPASVLDARRESGPDLLPPVFTAPLRHSFPYDQPAVFRSGHGHGRYIVHRIDKPIEHFEFEYDLWK